MTKKIRRSALFLVLISVILFSLGTSFLYYDIDKRKSIAITKDQALFLSETINVNTSEIELNPIVSQARITIIENNGDIIFDNKRDKNDFDNHGDRIEVIEALENGYGEVERYSDSFMEKTYYYAIKLDNGDILRVSNSMQSFYALVFMMLPFTISALLIIIVLANFITKRLTHNIILPIEKADLNSALDSPYKELDMYFNTMRAQKSEIKRQTIRVNKRKETINTILNSMQEGFMIVDQQLNVFLANQAFLEIFNLDKYEVGNSIFRYINDRKLLEKIQDALRSRSSTYKMELNNSLYQVYLSHTRILEDDVAILLFVDISDEAKNQKQREQFSANVSHELKTPLTSIKGLAELQANDMVKSEDIVMFGEKIFNQSNRLLEIIDHIIKLSEFDEDGIQYNFEDFNIKDKMEDILLSFNKRFTKKEISVTKDIQDIDIKANMTMIDELLSNLIDNAVKYNHEGGYINIDIRKEDNNLLINISNSGPVISFKDQERLFERFYRVDSSRNKKTGGSGLGLAIVKHIILYHKGSINVVSENDETRFEVVIPQ